MKQEAILQKLEFARRRRSDMQALNSGNFPSAPALEKHQLAQEFFFHLLGAVELTAQFTNEVLRLGIDLDRVTANNVIKKLAGQSAVYSALSDLYANPRKSPMPADPYSPDGLVYRAYNYRHQVTHRGMNPFINRVGSSPEVSFVLDPRENPPRKPSRLSLWVDMDAMYNRLSRGCQEVMRLLEKSSATAGV